MLHFTPLAPIKELEIVHVALETNGRGHMGYLVEFLGAFVRGRSELEALSKVNTEIDSYLEWLGSPKKLRNLAREILVTQRHESTLRVEDGDNEILLNADKEPIANEEFKNIADLVRFSGRTFLELYASSELKDWVDESRVRGTFYGDNPKTIREIFDHVNQCQYYYLSRTKLAFEREKHERGQEQESFLQTRDYCLQKLERLSNENNNTVISSVDNELWTVRKILRRLIWHDRIHAKAMVKILEKQKQLGIIGEYADPLYFNTSHDAT